MKTERNSPEIGEHRYGVVRVIIHNGEKTEDVLGKYKTREKMLVGYVLLASKLDKRDISEYLYPVEFNKKGFKILEDVLFELFGIVEEERERRIEEARRRHSLN